jgi:hypothetical protein
MHLAMSLGDQGWDIEYKWTIANFENNNLIVVPFSLSL